MGITNHTWHEHNRTREDYPHPLLFGITCAVERQLVDCSYG